MKLTTATSGVLCTVASLGCLVSLLLPTWRLGEGTKFLEHADSTTHIETYDERHFGLIHVSGKYTVAWSALARATCDKWTAVYGIAMLEGLIIDGSPCVSAADSDEECPNNYANHMMHRCTEYTAIHQAVKVIIGMVVVSFVLTVVAVLLLFLGSVKANREVIFAMLIFADVCLLVGTVWYVYATDASFQMLRKQGTYPYPSLAWSFWVFFSFAMLHCLAVLLFGWTKVFSKWVYGSSRPDNWVPPSQRALLGEKHNALGTGG